MSYRTLAGSGVLLMASMAMSETIVVKAKAKSDSQWNEYATRTVDALPGFDAQTGDGALSPFGGLLSKKTDATGFFYAKQVDGRWWLVDPVGCLYINKAVVAVAPGSGPTAPGSWPRTRTIPT